MGRLTLNPLPHIDLWLTILMPVMLWLAHLPIFGAAKPVPVRPDRYRNYVKGDIIVSLAGIFTNLLILVVSGLLFIGVGVLARSLPPGSHGFLATAQQLFFLGVSLNLLLAFFNLIPLPPLDGSHVLYHVLPEALRPRYRAIQRFGLLPLLAIMLLFPRAIQALFAPVFQGVDLFLRLTAPYAVSVPSNIFPA